MKFKRKVKKEVMDLEEKSLLARMEQTVKDKDSFIQGKKNIFDYEKAGRKVKEYVIKTESKNRIDIIPYRVSMNFIKNFKEHSGRPCGANPGELSYKLEYPVHRWRTGMCLCLRVSLGKKCVICDEYFRLKKKSSEDARIFFPKWRCAYNVIDVDKPEKGILFFDHSFMLFEKYLKLEASLGDAGIIPFCSLKHGSTLVFKGIRKYLGSQSYIECPSIDFVDREDVYKNSIVDKAYPLDKMIEIPTEEEVEQMFFGAENAEYENDKEEEEEEEEEEDDDIPY